MCIGQVSEWSKWYVVSCLSVFFSSPWCPVFGHDFPMLPRLSSSKWSAGSCHSRYRADTRKLGTTRGRGCKGTHLHSLSCFSYELSHHTEFFPLKNLCRVSRKGSQPDEDVCYFMESSPVWNYWSNHFSLGLHWKPGSMGKWRVWEMSSTRGES